MGETMEKLKPYLTALLLLSLILFPSCAAKRSLPDYRAAAFSVELRWETEGQTVYAHAEYEAPSPDGTVRNFRLRFTAPESMKGMTLTRKGEHITLERDGLLCDGSKCSALLSVADLLITEGTIKSLGNTEWNGLTLRYAEIRDTEGEVISLLLDPESGSPKQAVRKDTTLTVLRFEKT